MATFPSITSARASYQRVVGRPVASISWTRHVKREPSGDDQCGSMRVASQSMPSATPISSTVHTRVTARTLRRHRTARGVGGALALGVAAVLTACSGGSKAATPTTSAATAAVTAPTTAPPSTTVLPTTTTLKTGPADLGMPAVASAQGTSALGSGDLDPAVRDQVLAAVHTYLDAATGTPLGTGGQADLSQVLTAAAAGRLNPSTRDALADEGLPPLGAIKADRDNVALSGFMGPDQAMVVTVGLDLQVSAATPAGAPVKIIRNGTLTYVSDGGTWKIDSFNLNVERDTP
jgi:hypothetical protein